MAGVGIELQKLLKHDSYFNLLRAYGYAAILGAGPWIISIVAILLVELLKVTQSQFIDAASQFQISAIYLIATSLIFSSFAQQSFTRLVSDHVYNKNLDYITPNYIGLFFLMTVASGAISLPVCLLLFPGQSLVFRLLLSSTFVLLCNIWYATCLLTGLKKYSLVLFAFFCGYGITIALGYQMRAFGVDGLLFAFFVGQFILLFAMVVAVFLQYPSNRFIAFDFLRKKQIFYSLVFSSLFYNCAIWADKFIFWYAPVTGDIGFGPLHVSIIYDLPMFFAYVTMIPGMALFLFAIETDFALYYQKYYQAICEGHSLSNIVDLRYHMIAAAKRGICAVLRIQCLIVVLVYILGSKILQFFNLSTLYGHLLNIDVVGTSLLVLLIAMLNIFSYLDRQRKVFWLTFWLFVLNVAFTVWSLALGPYYYGYGFTISVGIITVVSFILLDYDTSNLERQTFIT